MTKKLPMLDSEHQLYTDAVDAMKRYHEAQASARPEQEIERLRQKQSRNFER